MGKRDTSIKTNGEISETVLSTIEGAVAGIIFGSITLIVQDGRLLQMERLEKIRFDNREPLVLPPVTGKVQLRDRLAAALNGLQYGQVILLIRDGRITHIERIEKQRLEWVEGRYGDGI